MMQTNIVMHKLRVCAGGGGGGGLQGQRDLLIVFLLLRAGVLVLSRELFTAVEKLSQRLTDISQFRQTLS